MAETATAPRSGRPPRAKTDAATPRLFRQKGWDLFRWLVIATSAVGAGLVVAIGGADAFTLAMVSGAAAGFLSGLRLVGGPMTDDHDPFTRRERIDRADLGRFVWMLGDLAVGLAALAVGALAGAFLPGAEPQSIIAIPLPWLLGLLPGVVAGLVASLVVTVPVQLLARRRRGRIRLLPALASLGVVAIFVLLAVGIVATSFAVEDADGVVQPGRALWVLFGGEAEGVSIASAPLAWTARVAFGLIVGILASFAVGRVRAERRTRGRRAS